MTTAAMHPLAQVHPRVAAGVRHGAALLVVLAAWEVVGLKGWVGDGALPAPTAIVQAFWTHRGDYPAHVTSTVRIAAIAFALGNVAAVILGVVVAMLPALERALQALMLVLFCLPVVVAAPILAVALPGDWPKVALGMLLVFYPTYNATVNGLRHASADALLVVRSAGGGAWKQTLLVRLRSALPDVLSGLQVAAPAAVLGALLGEFMGSQAGLGVYLLGSMGRADPAVLWAIGLVATTIAASGYAVFGLLRSFVATDREALALPALAHPGGGARRPSRVLWSLVSFGVVIAAWYGFIAATGLPSILMNSPIDVWSTLVSGERAAQVRAVLVPALGHSLFGALLGAAAGIAVAFVLAVLLSQFSTVAATVLPFCFLSQTMPIVALTPLIALVFGRGLLTVVVVTISVTFFPALVTILVGLRLAPTGPLDVMASVHASRWSTLRWVIVPNAMPYVFNAVKLAAPRALTGVLIAEQFVTGTGLGGQLGQARGYLDYQLMWAIAAVVSLVSVLVYAVADVLERRMSIAS